MTNPARLPECEESRSRFHAWPPVRTGDAVEVRVFPNLSNRLAYHLQLFLPFGLNKYLSDQAGSFDVAHLHACRNIPGAIAAYHLHRAGVPYVLAPNGTGAANRAAPAGQARVRRRDGTTHPRRRARACWPCRTPNGCRSARSGVDESARPRHPQPDRSRRVHAAAFARRLPPALRASRRFGRTGRDVSREADAAQAGRRAGPRVRAARPPRRAAGDCRQRHGRGRRYAVAGSVARPRGAYHLHRPVARAGTARGARGRGRRGLSLAGRGLRPRAARSAALGHTGHRRRRFRLRRDRPADRRRPGRPSRRCGRAGARHRRRCWTRPPQWRAATGPAAGRIRAAFGEDVVCAGIEQLYSEMVAAS